MINIAYSVGETLPMVLTGDMHAKPVPYDRCSSSVSVLDIFKLHCEEIPKIPYTFIPLREPYSVYIRGTYGIKYPKIPYTAPARYRIYYMYGMHKGISSLCQIV